MSLRRRFARWIDTACRWWRRGDRVVGLRVADEPDRLDRGVIYVIGVPQAWAAVMSCPCGCGSAIHLNLLPGASPRWDIEDHGDRAVTVCPSIWRTSGCRSHFFIREGRVVWTPALSEAP